MRTADLWKLQHGKKAAMGAELLRRGWGGGGV